MRSLLTHQQTEEPSPSIFRVYWTLHCSSTRSVALGEFINTNQIAWRKCWGVVSGQCSLVLFDWDSHGSISSIYDHPVLRYFEPVIWYVLLFPIFISLHSLPTWCFHFFFLLFPNFIYHYYLPTLIWLH